MELLRVSARLSRNEDDNQQGRGHDEFHQGETPLCAKPGTIYPVRIPAPGRSDTDVLHGKFDTL